MILPVEFPPITTSPEYADLLSTVLPQKGGQEWYFSSFIQVFSDYRIFKKGEIRFREHLFALNKTFPQFWYHCNPFLYSYNAIDDFSILFEFENIIEKFKQFIDDKYYLIVYLDRHYLDNTYKIGSIHSMLIYGYDQVSFKVTDFISEGSYTFVSILFSDVLESYKYKYKLPKHIDYAKKLVMFKMKNTEYKTDGILIQRTLEDYLYERNTTESYELMLDISKHHNPIYWGMSCIKYLISVLSYAMKNDLGLLDEINIKSMFLMYDHKKAMCERIKYFLNYNFIENHMFYDEYEIIKTKMLNCVNICIKYNISKNDKLLHRAISVLDETYDREKYLLEKLITEFTL